MLKSMRLDYGVVAAAMLLAAGLAACSRPPPPAPEPESAELQRVRAQSDQTHRAFMAGLYGEGQALIDTCKPGAPESARLTFHDPDFKRAFTLGFVAEAKGATAMWQGLQQDAATKRVATVGVQGVRLDGNGWRQVRQSLTNPDFATLPPEALSPVGPRYRDQGDTWRIESCLAGNYRLTTRHKPDADRDRDFLRAARGMMRLAGSLYW